MVNDDLLTLEGGTFEPRAEARDTWHLVPAPKGLMSPVFGANPVLS